MKKLLVLILMVSVLFIMSSCGNDEGEIEVGLFEIIYKGEFGGTTHKIKRVGGMVCAVHSSGYGDNLVVDEDRWYCYSEEETVILDKTDPDNNGHTYYND